MSVFQSLPPLDPVGLGLSTGNPLTEGDDGLPVYSVGQKAVGHSYMNFAWSWPKEFDDWNERDQHFAAIMQAIDKVPDPILLTVAEELADQQRQTKPSLEEIILMCWFACHVMLEVNAVCRKHSLRRTGQRPRWLKKKR